MKLLDSQNCFYPHVSDGKVTLRGARREVDSRATDFLESLGATEDDGLVWLKEDAQQRFLSGHWGVEGLGGWGGGKLGKLGKWTEAIIHF